MSKNNNFSVFLVGFSQYEKRLFGSIATLTRGRTRTYRLTDDESKSADIVVVNGDDAEALQAWMKQFGSSGARRSVVVSASPPLQPGVVHIRRPLIVTRVISALDQVVIEDLRFAPDLVIEQEAHLSAELNGALERMPEAVAKEPRHRALVVDDSHAVRKLMEIELRISGISGDFAESAGGAWELLSRNNYDIVFLDVVLPDVDGYTICKSLKKNRATKKIPVVMLTGKSSPFDRVRGKLAGCNSYLVKPVPHDALQKVFRRYLPVDDDDKAHERTPRMLRPAFQGV